MYWAICAAAVALGVTPVASSSLGEVLGRRVRDRDVPTRMFVKAARAQGFRTFQIAQVRLQRPRQGRREPRCRLDLPAVAETIREQRRAPSGFPGPHIRVA